MTNQEVAKAFLNKEQYAKNGQGSFSIREGVLYSYETPQAFWYKGVLIVNSLKYSVTTSKQMSKVRRHDAVLVDFGSDYTAMSAVKFVEEVQSGRRTLEGL